MFLISEDEIAMALKVPQYSRKGGGHLFYSIYHRADFALTAVVTNNHQMGHVSKPDYSKQARALSFSLLPVEPDTVFSPHCLSPYQQSPSSATWWLYVGKLSKI